MFNISTDTSTNQTTSRYNIIIEQHNTIIRAKIRNHEVYQIHDSGTYLEYTKLMAWTASRHLKLPPTASRGAISVKLTGE
jgi:hypothetical protein